MFKLLGRITVAHPWIVCAAWLLCGTTAALFAPSWDRNAQDDDVRFLPERCASVRGYRLLEQSFPQDVYASRVIFTLERDNPLTRADLDLVDGMVADLQHLKHDEPALQIGRIYSHRDPFIGKRLLSADGKCTLIQVSLATPYLAVQTRETVDRAEQIVRQRLAQRQGDAPQLFVTGPAGIGRDLIAASADSLESTTLATIVLVVVILLLVHRAPLLALVPLVTIAVSTWVALKLLALCTLIPGFYLVNVSQVFAVVMLYGAGTDYCLFLLSRYREELAAGYEKREALSRSLGAVGGALAASAGTVICGLGLMGLAEFAKVRCGGPAIALSLAVALLASLTLAPALLRLLGKAAFWPVGLPRSGSGSPRWNWLSHKVVSRPIAVWLTAILVLLPLAFLGLSVKANYRATGELAPASSSVQGLAAVQRHFTAGEVGPVTVLLEAPFNWESKEGQIVIAHLSQGFLRLSNVAEVRSLTQPLGQPLPESPMPDPARNIRESLFQTVWGKVVGGVTDVVNRSAREFYVSRIPGEPARFVTRLDVVVGSDPFDPRSQPTLDLIQIWLREELPRSTRALGEVRGEVYGVTVNARDLARVTEADRTRINVLVLAGIFLILLLLVRRPWLAGYLLATVLFSYFATLGATTLTAHWWNGRPLGEVDWRVPFFLFTILVAVGEDYNILLMTRALKERKRHGASEGMRLALARTGGTITSCGLIMAGTFATLMLAGLSTLVQIGFALAFGVLLDTFIVRPFLVPALVVWVWRREDPAAKEWPTRWRRAG
jgi:RND superfamily putative drug exporter